MAKTKRKGGIVTPPTREGHHAGHDAPDNPPSIPRGPSPVTEEDPGRNPPESVEHRRSSRIRLNESATMDTGDEPVTSATKHGLVEQGSDRKGDHDRRSAQNSGSRHRSSALTPLEEVEGTNRSPSKGNRSESSLA